MANEIALVTADTIRVVGIPIEQFTYPGGESITAGAPVRLDTTTGKLTKSNASSTTEDRILGIALRTPEATGLGITVIRQGVLDGYDLSALDYDAVVYLSDTDGRLSTVAGTTGKVVGRVIPGWAQPLGSSPDKLLLLELNQGPKGEPGEDGA